MIAITRVKLRRKLSHPVGAEVTIRTPSDITLSSRLVGVQWCSEILAAWDR